MSYLVLLYKKPEFSYHWVCLKMKAYMFIFLGLSILYK